jgi:long-chain fatty acid transport protein
MIKQSFGRKAISAALPIALALIISTPAWGGGLYISEFGQPGMGLSGAGWNVLAEDASTGIANAAGIFWLEDDSEWMVTGLYVTPSLKFRSEEGTTVPGVDGGDAGVSAIGGSLFHSRKLSDKWAFGIGVNSISAAAIKYDTDFVGRHWAQKVDLLTITATANLAYKVNDSFAVSIGVPMMFGRLDQNVAIPALLGPALPERDGLAKVTDGKDFSATIAFGLYWQSDEKTRWALTFLGKNKLNFDGDLEVTLPGAGSGNTIDNIDATLGIPFPRALSGSIARDVSDRTTLLATVGWEDWSELDEILINTDVGSGQFSYDWEDTWKFALGLRIRGSGRWKYYTGVAYDTSPTSAYKRTADMPIDRQIRLSAGASYTMDSGKVLNGSFTYADYGDARINNSNGGGHVVGEYRTNRILFFGFSLGW